VTSTPALDLLTGHGAAVLFAWSFAVQGGAPLPAVPMLLGAGALSGSGQMNLALALGAAIAATLAADVIWYALGWSMGTRVLGALCRLSLDPDSFVRRAKERFLAHRARCLILAKFLPGLNPLAAGLAGVVGIRPGSFLLYDAAGALLWAGGWITLGYVCSGVIGLIATQAARLGAPLVIVIAAVLIAYLVVKSARRQRFLRHLRKARLTPMELKRRLEAGDHLVIVDLRTALDIEAAPYGIPGARRIAPEMLEHPHPHHLIPRESEVVFYCAEPREATSAWMALRLGFKNVHALSGGLDGWRQAGFDMEPLTLKTPNPPSALSPST
jgi:membrane protein DedA with SNARE-associated domain/rhodanese-related sulfurtransferase